MICSFADIAYRNSDFVSALKILNPVAGPKAKPEGPASAKEKSIYSVNLMYLGGVEEAMGILKALDPADDPEITLFKSFGFFAQWKYAEAVPLLKKFIADERNTEYQRLVGEVNLVAAYVFSHQLAKAEEALKGAREKAAERENLLLYGNCLELGAHLNLLKNDLVLAQELLDLANIVLGNTKGRYLFYVKKGYAILEVLRSKGSQQSLNQLNDLRKEAVLLKQWETLRDCDLFEALATDNNHLLHKVVLGTPHVSYRKRVSEIFKKKITIPSNFELPYNTDPGQANAVLKVTEGIGADGTPLVRRPVMHLLLESLFLDLYKPAKLCFLFSHIFPDENFNPNTSPARIYGAVHNLNQWLQETKTPLHIKVHDGEFRVQATGGLTVVIENRKQKKGMVHFELKRLRNFVGCRVFKTIEAGSLLQLSKPTVFIILKQGLQEKTVVKIGKGRSTLYRFV